MSERKSRVSQLSLLIGAFIGAFIGWLLQEKLGQSEVAHLGGQATTVLATILIELAWFWGLSLASEKAFDRRVKELQGMATDPKNSQEVRQKAKTLLSQLQRKKVEVIHELAERALDSRNQADSSALQAVQSPREAADRESQVIGSPK